MTEHHIIVKAPWLNMRYRVIFIDGEATRVDVPYCPFWHLQQFKWWADRVWWWTEAWRSGDRVNSSTEVMIETARHHMEKVHG